MKNKLLSVFLFLGSFAAYSQVGIGTPMPNSSAQLEVVASDKGVLIPRINLTGSTDATTIKNGNVNSLLVFNTATVSDITPGYYYWYTNKWNRIVVSTEITSTPGTVIFNPVTQVFSYVDTSGNTQVIDIKTIVKANETLTTLVNNGNGSYTYTNEAGTAVNIDVVGDVTSNFSTIVNNPAVTTIIQNIVNKTEGNVTFNSTTNEFSYVDNSGNTQLVDISKIVKANETLTTLFNNGAGSYTYTNEAGNAVNIDVVGDVTTNFTTIVNDPAVTTIIKNIVNKTEGNVTFNSTTNEFSYVDNSGNTQVIDISKIVKANETITTLVGNSDGSYTYTNEAGTAINIDVVGDVTTNFSTIVNNPAVTNIIQEIVDKTKGIVTFNSTTNQFSYIDNSGNTQLVDISTIVKANETITTLNKDASNNGQYTYTSENATATTIDVVGDVINNSSAILNNSNFVTQLTNIIKTNETLTTLVYDQTLNTLTYKDEHGTSYTILLVDLVGNAETKTTLVYDSMAKTLTYNGESGLPTVINLLDLVGDAETVTTITPVVTSGNTIATYTNETGGTPVEIKETTTSLTQNPTTGAITYNNETGIGTFAQIKSSDAGNILTTGTDGGTLLTPAAIASATTVSNASAVNTSTITVNGITSLGAPIINSNSATLTGSSLTTTVNGVTSTPVDLSPIITAGTTNTLSLLGNTLTSNVNGVPATSNAVSGVSNASANNTSTVTVNGITSSGAPIINSNSATLTGSSLTTTVNGVASTPVDLSPIITAGTTNTLSLSGNILTSNVNGVPATSNAVSGVSNASAVNTSTVTVNGITSSGAPIINSNSTTLTGSNLTTTVNGVASTALDLTPAIAAGQIVTNLAQNPTTGLITYTNESAIDQTAAITSTDAANILTVGTDGGSLLTPAAITSATTVSNASAINTSTVTVNGITSSGAPIVNSNTTSLTGSNLTTTVNGVASTALDLKPAITAATTNALAATNGNLISTVNGVATTPAVPVLIAADNGITATNGNTQLGGALIKPTTITTDVTNTLALAGLQTGANTDNIVVVNASGVLKTIAPSSLNTATTVSNTSTVNSLTTTVNTVTGTPVNIINSNALSLTGANLTSTVNGVASTVLNLAPAIKANETITTITPLVNSSSTIATYTNEAGTPVDIQQTVTKLSQDPSTGSLNFINEEGIPNPAQVISTDVGNLITVGNDGGALLNPAALSSATTVSNNSSVNSLTTTVNGQTGTAVNIVNSNATSLTGSSLTTTVNGVSSIALNLAPAIAAATTNTLTATNGNLVSTVNGVASTPAVPILTTANNGITAANGNVQLGGALTKPTSIDTDFINTLSITGLQFGPPFADVLVLENGILRMLPSKELNMNNWSIEGNMGINSGFHFLGTIDDADLVFKRNSIVSGKLQTNNTSFGVNTLGLSSTGINNVAIGTSALSGNTTGSNNATLGYNALAGNATGEDNTAVGSGAGSLNSTGSRNTFIGNNANPTGGVNLDNATAIGYNSQVANSNSLVLGGIDVDAVNVGIGTDAPSNTLHIKPAAGIDPLRAEGLQAGAITDNVVVADANGIFKTVTAASLIPVTTVSNTSTTNSLTTTVNGQTGAAVNIINSNATSLTGTNLTTTVNGVASTALDLAPAIAAGTTHSLSLTGNTLTSTVNGVPGTSSTVSGVSNASATNTATVTVNGITSAGAPIINSNATSLTGTNLTTTVNGVASTALDLAPAIAAGTTHSLSLTGNTLTSTVNGVPGTSSTVSGVSNASAINTATVTVNGITSAGAPIINSNGIALTGASLTSTVNGVASTALDLTPAIKANETVTTIAPVVTLGNTIATYTNEAAAPVDIKETVTSLKDVVTQVTDPFGQLFDLHTLTYTDELNAPNPIDLSVLVKGVETLTSLTYDGAAHSLIYNDEDGNASEFKLVDLVGDAQTLTKLEVNPTTGTLDYTDENATLNAIDLSEAVKEPWFSTTTHIGAILNTEDIYTNGWVGIGYTTPSGAANEKLRVNGAISTVNNYYADYVFEDYFKGFSKIKSDYKFKSLPEIEKFIKENKHLPGITPINELEKTKEGYAFNMSELSIQLLEKTEEIYLHIIEQSKEIEAKNKEIKELKEASKEMNLRLEKLEKLIAEKDK